MRCVRLLLSMLAVVALSGGAAEAVPTADFGFALSAGGGGSDAGNSVATDAAGNVYATGDFSGTVDFDPGAGTFNLTSAGFDDVFVAKYTSAGALVWARRIGGSEFDRSHAVAVDGQGSVYTTGIFTGMVDFDPEAGTFNLVSAGSIDVFVSKLNSGGNFVWARQLSGSGAEAGHAVATDAAGNVYVTGDFSGTVDFDPGAGTFNLASAGFNDVFVSKLNSRGNFVWARRIGGSDFDGGLAVAVDGQGNVYTTGRFNGTADFDPGAGSFNLTSAGSVDVFVSKLDGGGNFVWARRIGGSGYDEGGAAAVDGQGSVYTTGTFAGTVDFDPEAGTFNLVSAGFDDMFVSKLDGGGNFVWARRMGSVPEDGGSGVAVDGQGNVYTTGFFRDTADFDPGPGTFNLSTSDLVDADLFVWKLDNNGKFVWAKRMGGRLFDVGYAVAVDGQGNVYTTGLFNGTADFDPDAGTVNLISAGLGDMFVSKLTQRTIGDRVWHDLDGDGIQDAGEPGIAGAAVELFRWTGATPAGGHAVSLGVQITDANGAYRFVGPPESFRFYGLRFRPLVLFTLTVRDAGGDDTLDSDADPITGGTSLFELPAGNTLSLDAGFTGSAASHLTVDKILVHPDHNHLRLFNLRIDGVTVRANVNAGSTGPQPVGSGTHTVGETGGTGTSLGAFHTVIGGACADDGTVSLAPGDSKTCTITNYDNWGGCDSGKVCCEPGAGEEGCLVCSQAGAGCP